TPDKATNAFDVVLSKLEWAGIADLEAADITGKWDGATLTYFITTPSEYAVRQDIDYSPPQKYSEAEVFKPSFIAAVVNLNSTTNLSWTDSTVTAPFTLSADGLLKVWEIAFEGSTTLYYKDAELSNYWSKMRSIVDIPSMETRFIGGKVTGEGISFQSRPELFGASLKTDEVFSRYDRNASPSVAFVLQKASTVYIVSNGVILRSFKLEKGNYRIYDLPFTFGLNDFQIEIESDPADSQILRPVDTYISTETGLLVGGRMEYGLSGGVGTTEIDQPFGSGFIRYGLTYNLTGGLYFQADARSALGGFAAVYGSRIGGITAEAGALGAWDGRANPFAMASEVSYQYTFSSKPSLPGIELTATWVSEGFTAPSPSATVSDPESYVQIAANVGAKLSEKSSIGLSGNWNRTLSGTITDTGGIGLNMGIAVGGGTSLSLSSGISLSSDDDPECWATLSVYAVNPKRSSGRISFMQNLDSTNTVSYSDRSPVLGGLNYGLQGQNLAAAGAEQTTLSANASLSTNFGDISTNASTYFGGTSGVQGGSANLNMSTALAFAGGSFAISRPISDSFVIFDPDKTTGDMAVEFGTDTSGKILSHGGPVVLTLSSYRPARATMNFIEADADVAATVPQSLLVPGYRSGILFKAGLLKKYYVSGKLMDTAGKPVGYIAGEICNAKGEAVDVTFTTEDGAFEMYGLTPGSYTIRWPDDVGTTAITLGEDTDGQIELGEITAIPIGGNQ
ncbi:MAG: fimbria/pilus outer membrane usher protein, partial [Rectinema sp.]